MTRGWQPNLSRRGLNRRRSDNDYFSHRGSLGASAGLPDFPLIRSAGARGRGSSGGFPNHQFRLHHHSTGIVSFRIVDPVE